jgi:hypothetical protein
MTALRHLLYIAASWWRDEGIVSNDFFASDVGFQKLSKKHVVAHLQNRILQGRCVDFCKVLKMALENQLDCDFELYLKSGEPEDDLETLVVLICAPWSLPCLLQWTPDPSSEPVHPVVVAVARWPLHVLSSATPDEQKQPAEDPDSAALPCRQVPLDLVPSALQEASAVPAEVHCPSLSAATLEVTASESSAV